MSENTAVDTMAGLDYEEIEEAVMETARGRWFLTEFARRQRGADTRILLDAIRRLEDQLLSMPTTISATPDLNPLVAEAEGELHRLSGTGAPAPVAAKPEAPAFVPSDDDIFEACPSRPQSAAVVRAPIPPTALVSDTLNFSNIQVPPLPDNIADEEDAHVVQSAPCAPVSTHAETGELKARDRVIQVTRSGSRMSPPPGPRASMAGSGRINTASPSAANTAVAGNPVAASNPVASSHQVGAGARPSGNGSSEDGKNKRIIVIRRPAGGMDGIPLAGDSFDSDGPGTA